MGILDFFRPNVSPSVAAQANASFNSHAAASAAAALKQPTPTTKVATSSGSGIKDFFKAAANGGLAGKNAGGWMGKAGGLSESQKTANVTNAGKGVLPFNFSAVNNPSSSANQSLIKVGGSLPGVRSAIKQASIDAATPKAQTKIQNPTKIVRVEMPTIGDSTKDAEYRGKYSDIMRDDWIKKYSDPSVDRDKAMNDLKNRIDKAPTHSTQELLDRAKLVAEYQFLEAAKNYGVYMDYDLQGGYDKVRAMDKQIDELKDKIQRYDDLNGGNAAMSWDVDDKDDKAGTVSAKEYEQARADLQALQQYRAALKLEVDDAKRTQLGEIYGRFTNEADYAAQAEKGAKRADNKRVDHAGDKSSLYSFMTEDEAQMYDYLLSAVDEKHAEQFYDFYLAETLKARAGQARAERINENYKTDFGRTVAADLHGLSSGVSRAGRGLWAALPGTSNDVNTTVGDYAAGYIRENLGKMDSGMNSTKPLNESNFSQMTFDAANSMGNMLPMILTSMLVPHVGAALGTSQAATATAAQVAAGGVMGLGVYGNVRDEMMKAGYNEKAASTYAALNAASEVALEKVLGGFDALGGAMGIQGLENAVSQIGNAYLRFAATMTVKAMGEGTEEYLQDVIDPLFRNIAFNESNGVDILSEEGAYSYLVAAMSVFGGPTEVISTYKNVARCEAAGAYVNAVREANPELYDTLINDAINSDDEDISEFAENLKDGTYKPNNGNMGQLLLMMAEAGSRTGRWSEIRQVAQDFVKQSALHLTEMKFGEIQSDARAAAQAEWDRLVMTNPDKKVYSPIETTLAEKTGWDADTVEEQANIISKVISGIVPTHTDAKTLDWNNQYVRDILEQYSGVTLTDTDDIGDRRLQLIQISQNAAETESYQQALKEANEAFLNQRSGEILSTPEYSERAEQAGNEAARGTDLAIGRSGFSKKKTAPITIPANPARGGGSAAVSGVGGVINGMDYDAFIQAYMEQRGVDQSQAEAAWNERAAVNSALNGGDVNGEQVRSASEGRVDGMAPGGSTSEVHERRAGSGESEAVTGDGAEAAASAAAETAAERVQGKVIAEADYTEEQTAFVESCTNDGFNSVTLVDGDLFNSAGQRLNAKVDRNGNLTISATDIETMNKVARHERVHLWLNSLGENRAEFVRNTLERVLSPKMLDNLFTAYARVYAGAYSTLSDQAFMDAVYEEILCDMYGGMDNYGAKASSYSNAAARLIDASTIRSDFLASNTQASSGAETQTTAQAASVEDTIEDRVRRDMGEDEEAAPDLADLAREEDYDGEYNPGYDEYYSVAETDKEIHDSLPQETQQALAENGLTIQNGVIVSNENAELMRREEYQKPQTWDEQFSVKTEPEWEANYRAQGGDPAVAETVKRITDWMIANEAVYNYLPHGEYASSKFGPLRPNMEYIVTFDMDTSCPRTFQYIHIRDMLQRYAKRPLTFNESINLLNVMKQTNQMIPCTYCYVENKRILKSSQYLNYYAARDGVMSAKDAASAKKLMYSYNAKKGTLGKAAQEVFNQWRNDVARGEAFHPSAEECWENVMQAQISISNWLDGQLQMKQIGTDTPTTELLDQVNKKFGITDAAAQREVANFVDQWVYETKADNGHNFALENNGESSKIDQRYLTVHNAAMQYANSSSSARSVDNYVPYTDQLKNISDEDRAFVMGMGGIRKHSSNDFRMDYVQDYLMFYADLAAGKWTGHTYTKSTDFCKIFGRTGDRINLSIAFDTKDGKVIMNDQEGANWKEAQELRKAYYNNLGTMAMVTDDLQLSYALNTDWIDMIIPFHASGLPKEVWRNMKAWNDYTSKQLEKYLNATDMKAALKARGVKVPSGAKAAAVAELYNKEFGTKFIYNENGKRQRPHFYPNDTYVKGPDGEMQLVPGHHNDVDTYFQLCEEYGVHPRFYGLNVTDAQGNVIPVTEHPNYLKLIKETARTETEQQPIEFNLDQYDDYLGMSPMEFIQERLTQESEAGGYENMKVDPAGIIKLFQKDYIGKDRPIGYLSESAARKIKGMSKTMAYKEIEANALGLKPADVDKLHQTPEAQMLHQRMEEMGLDTRYSFAGATAETADSSRLQTAEQMEQEGRSSEEIRQQTGWFRGMDNLWRYEISDKGMKILPGFNQNADGMTLGSLIQHDQLFAAYPQLQDITVKLGDYGSTDGMYTSWENSISLNNALLADKKKLRSVLAHELQHAIQRIEGFSKGSSPEYWQTHARRQREYLENRVVALEQQTRKAAEELDAVYKDIGYNEYEKELDGQVWMGDISEAEAETMLRDYVRERSSKGYALMDLYDTLSTEMRAAKRELNSYPTAYDMYTRTAGEIEANDVQKRLTLDEQKRQAKRPNIDRDDVVFARFSVHDDADDRVSQVRTLYEAGRTPSQISNETGLTLMGNGNIIDPATHQVIGRIDTHAAGRSEELYAAGEEERASEAGVPGDDRRGVSDGSRAQTGAQTQRAWEQLGDDERTQVTGAVQDYLADNPGELYDELRADYEDEETLIQDVYESYRQGRVIFENEAGAYTSSPEGLYDRISEALTNETNARTDNGDGRFALDEDVEQEPVISPEVAAQEIEQTDELYSVRSEDPPKKTLIGYKVFAVDKKHPGELYPTKVDNPGGQGTPVGVWLNADTGEIARNKDGSIKTNKNGRIAVKADGGSLAWRPGWHLGSLPEANQMNRVDPNNPESNMANRDSTGLMWDNYVFCECEFAADEDYQLEAFQMGFSEKGTYKHTEAGLPYLPKDGYYKYRTNPNPNTAPWFISGAIKITKILDDNMRREIIDQWNKEHPDEPMRLTPRYSGKDIDLSEYGFTAGPVTPTENLGEIAPGVDYSDEIKDLPGYKPNHINWDNENFQNAFKINGIEDRREELRQKYESNPERYSVFSDQVDEVKNNTHNPQQAVRMGQTPRPLSDVLWLPKLPMLITPSHVYSMAVSEAQARAENRFKPRTNYHDLGWDVVKQIPEQLAHPVMIIKSNTDPNNADVLVLTDLVDKQGRPVAVAIHPDGRGKQLGLSLPENAVLSGYGRNNVQNYLARAKTENRILYANKNNHQRGSRGVRYSNASAHNSQGVQYSDAIMSGDYSDNLAQYQQIVKDKFKGTIFENSVGLSYSVANDPDNHFQPGSLESDMYDLLKADSPEGVEQVINKQLSQAQANRERQATKPLIPPADKVIPVGKAERTYQRNQLDEMIKKYGKIPQGEKAARDIALPNKTDADHFVRKFVRTIEEAPNTSQRTVENIERAVVTKSDIANYARISDTKANSAADRYYATYGYGKMLKEWNGLVDSNKRVTKWDIAKGERLLIEADAQGDNQAVMRLVGDLAAMGTEAGQVVQAMRLLKKMGPVGQLYYFQKAVDRMNTRYQNRIVNGRMAPIIINQEFAERVLLADTQEEIDKAMEDLIKDTAKQLPVSLADKWNAWRYLSMLGNPRTHIRNILGNALFRPLITTKDLLAAAGETIFLKDRSQRTKSASYLLSGGKYSAKYRDVVNFANSDFKVMRSEIDGTGKMNTANKLLAAREIYKGPLKFLNTLTEGNSNLLEFEDGMFLKKAYVNALSEYMIAQGLTAEDIATDSKALNQARQYAVLEAQKATYRDYCGLANALNSLRNRDSFASQVLVDGIMPFTKTPTNILRRGIEYSPIGLIKGITYDLAKVKQGEYTAAEAIDHIAAGMTGTMVAVLGAFLASMGVARGADDDDKKKAELERAQGHQEYSLEIGGMSFTVDWVAPVSLPFFTGVEAYKRISNGGPLDFYDMADLVTLIAEPMLSLSMLDGLNQTLTAASYGENNALQAVLTQIGTSYVSQGLPTLGAQIARTLDPYRRANYVDKNSKAPGWMQNFVQQSMGKIPGVADEKMAYVDMWGRKQSTGGLGMRALENFIFPFYMKNINENPVEHELLRLANATGDNSVLPSSISKSFSVDGQTRNLTGDQYEKLKTTTGRESLRLLGELMLTPAYSALDDAEKAKVIKNAMTITAAVGRQSVEPDYAPAAWVQRAIDNDNFEDAVIFHTMQSMESGLTNYQLIECMYWLNPDDQGKLISAQYTPQVNMTDYTKKKHKFILDDDMKARSREIYEQMFWVEYPKLYSSQAWANADIAGRADLVKKLQTDVGKAARSAYGDELRAQGVVSVYLDDPMEEAEEIAAMINELGYEP